MEVVIQHDLCSTEQNLDGRDLSRAKAWVQQHPRLLSVPCTPPLATSRILAQRTTKCKTTNYRTSALQMKSSEEEFFAAFAETLKYPYSAMIARIFSVLVKSWKKRVEPSPPSGIDDSQLLSWRGGMQHMQDLYT